MFPRNATSRILCEPRFEDLPPILGIEVASDMSVYEAVLFAWRNCATLNRALTVGTIDVLHFSPRLFTFYSHSHAGYRHGSARSLLERRQPGSHFSLRTTSIVNSHVRASLLQFCSQRDTPHRFTQHSPFFFVLDNLLHHPDRTMLDPYKP